MTPQLHCHSLCSLTTLFPLKATSSDRIVTSSLVRLDEQFAWRRFRPWITVLCGSIMWGYLWTDGLCFVWEHYVGVPVNRRAVFSCDRLGFVQSGGIGKKYISEAYELFSLLWVCNYVYIICVIYNIYLLYIYYIYIRYNSNDLCGPVGLQIARSWYKVGSIPCYISIRDCCLVNSVA